MQAWRGVVSGDSRSFAQVVRSRPPMDQRRGAQRINGSRQTPPRNNPRAGRIPRGLAPDRRRSAEKMREGGKRRESEKRTGNVRKDGGSRMSGEGKKMRGAELRTGAVKRKIVGGRISGGQRDPQETGPWQRSNSEMRQPDPVRVAGITVQKCEMDPAM